MVGDWTPSTGVGYGPFGFGTDVILDGQSCMSDSTYIHPGDQCQLNPKFCANGISFSIWEKVTYTPDILVDLDSTAASTSYPKKYVVSTGAQYDKAAGTAYPGFAVYHEGAYIVAVVSTGDEVWEIRVAGQLFNDSWSNIGVRWEQPNFNDTSLTVDQLGGLELYINLEKVGHSVMPETTDAGSPNFQEVTGYQIDGKDPPVIMVGCQFDQDTQKFDDFSSGEYDELALWSKYLGTNASYDQTVFFFGGFESQYANVDAAQFKALLSNVDLSNNVEASVANDVLQAMLLTRPPTTPAIPTRTTPQFFGDAAAGSGSNVIVTSKAGATTTATTAAVTDPNVLARSQLAIQSVMSTMLATTNVPIVVPPDQVEMRLPLSIVAAKIISGQTSNAAKWQAVYDVNAEAEGAPKTVRELEEYMLTWVGATNTSATKATQFFNPDDNTMKYATSGEDFVMNVQKLPPDVFHQAKRLTFPNYTGPEWTINKNKWDNTKDTFSLPTGMFKDQPGCNDNPVTFSAAIYNMLGISMPSRRNLALIRDTIWAVDSKIISTAVSVDVDPMTYDASDVAAVAACKPNQDYMNANPVSATLYHKQVGTARLVRRLLAFFTDNPYVVGGIEVRQCARWNYDFGSGGAWDPNGCTLVTTDSEKTSCQCPYFGMMAVVREQTPAITAGDSCMVLEIIKYVGIAISAALLGLFIFVTIGSKHVWDMFHVLRMNVSICWILAVLLHVATDFDAVRDDANINLCVGFLMMYFYTASVVWMALEAHATFKAFTSGIISGRTKVYIPFGYGVPFLPLGVLFVVYDDDLGLDPRCFVGWNFDAKVIYLMFNLVMSLMAMVFSIIITLNIRRPQTKRRNLVADLTSQAKGTVSASFFKVILWIFASCTYLHNQDSDLPDPYCIFIVYLGWFGVLLFFFLGFCSKKFRAAVVKDKQLKKAPYKPQTSPAVMTGDPLADEDIPADNSESVDDVSASRPATATSVVQNEEEEEEEEMEEEEGVVE